MKLVLLLALSILPVHHHRKHKVDPLDSGIPGNPCVMSYGLFAYYGDDGTAGFSDLSCNDAFLHWKASPDWPVTYHKL